MTVEQLAIVVLVLALAVATAVAIVRGRQLDRLEARLSVDRRAQGVTTAVDPAGLLALADEASVGLLRIDEDGAIALANEAAHGYLGRPSGGLLGLSTMEAFLDHRVEETVREGRRRGSAEREITFGGEPPRTLLVRVRREERDGGTWLVLQDVSELHRLRRIRTEFLDNLSHELRTPLSNVRLLTESLAMELERSEVPPRVREGIARIDVETGHLAQMVSELLDLARIEQGGGALRHEQVDLARVVEQALDRLRPHAEQQAVRLRVEAPAAAAERSVVGDEERLGQLLINLLHNAVKFSPPGGEVVVRVVPGPTETRLEVEDHGPGIPRRELERIFERFYKVDRARTRAATGGTGLGLSIARHIAEGHGGRIWAESEEGRGARFIVALPQATRVERAASRN
ncbi:MAG: cell wall metabolism sensor histidine kinase WalK [Chloroflexota bacterium]|nr:cell wall metabolism sensor histidine kinase WalK [Chloroflexota bacterium]